MHFLNQGKSAAQFCGAGAILLAMWKAVALITLAAFAAAKEEDKKIDGPVIGIDLGTWLHKSLERLARSRKGTRAVAEDFLC